MLGEGGAPVDDTKNRKAGRTAFYQTLTEGILQATFQGPATATPTVSTTLQATSFVIRPTSITGEQRTKLDYFFNIYQQYRLWGFKVMFRPRNTESIAKYATATATQATFQSVEILSADTQIVFVPEHDDTIVRNNLDEFYQAKMLPQSQSFLSTERGQLFVRATTLEATDADGTSPVDDQTGLWVSPKPSQWLSTKYENTLGNSLQNADIPFFGFKMYLYNPYFAQFTPVASPIQYTSLLGTLAIQCYWQFRNLDNRALLTPTVLTSLMSGEPTLAAETSLLVNPFVNRVATSTLVSLPDDVMEENGDPVEKPPLKRQRVDDPILATP